MSQTPFHRHLLDLSRDLAAAPGHDQFLSRTMDFLTSTFQPDQVLWSDIDLGRGRVSGWTDSSQVLAGEFAEQLLQQAIHHPGITSYLGQPTDLTPRRLSDLVPARVWLDSELYRDVFAAQGGRHQLSMVVELEPTRGVGWTLFRERVDFTDEHLARARMLLPLLTGFHQMFARLPSHPALPPMPLVSELTVREQEVVRLLGSGLTASAIGRRLGIRPATVRKHLEHIYAKFGAHDRVLVVNRARSMGLLPD
ncbi:MAG: response regulator transcription factor [Propionibacteriaceae bacterium]